jgi:hypothetical protein
MWSADEIDIHRPIHITSFVDNLLQYARTKHADPPHLSMSLRKFNDRTSHIIIPLCKNNHWHALLFDCKTLHVTYLEPFGSTIPNDILSALQTATPTATISSISTRIQQDTFQCGPIIVWEIVQFISFLSRRHHANTPPTPHTDNDGRQLPLFTLNTPFGTGKTHCDATTFAAYTRRTAINTLSRHFSMSFDRHALHTIPENAAQKLQNYVNDHTTNAAVHSRPTRIRTLPTTTPTNTTAHARRPTPTNTAHARRPSQNNTHPPTPMRKRTRNHTNYHSPSPPPSPSTSQSTASDTDHPTRSRKRRTSIRLRHTPPTSTTTTTSATPQPPHQPPLPLPASLPPPEPPPIPTDSPPP